MRSFIAWIMAALSSRFITDASRLASATLLSQALLVAVSPLLTRMFSPSDFGIFSMVVAMSGLAAVFSTMRLENVVPTVNRVTEAVRLVQAMVIASIAGAILILVAVVTLRSRIEAALSLPPNSGAAFYAVPVLILAYAGYAGIRAWCIRKARFGSIARSQIVRSAAMIGTWLSVGSAGIIKAPGLALTIGQAVGDLMLASALSRALSKREKWVMSRPRLRRIWGTLTVRSGMMGSLVSSQALAHVHVRVPLLVIGTVFGPVEAGYFALAERVVSAPSMLVAAALADVFKHRATKVYREGRSLTALMGRVLLFTAGVSIVPFLAVIALAPHAVGQVFGSEWQPVGFTISVMLISALVAFNSTSLDSTALIVGVEYYYVIWHGLRLLIEATTAAAAVASLLDYEGYLIAVVIGRSIVHLADLAMMFVFASRSDPLTRTKTS